MKVFYITSDNGDGSASVHFYSENDTTKDQLKDMMEELPEIYWGNEGQVGAFNVPDGFDTGLRFNHLREDDL